MADTRVILGGVAFAGFEVPEHIAFGGTQVVAKHKLVGDRRVLDAMGPEDDDITWSGLMRGRGAVARAERIDEMRRAGAQVSMSWAGIARRVIITHFRADVWRLYDVRYEIAVMVVDDGRAGASAGIAGIDELLGADLGAAASLIASSLGSVAGLSAGFAASVGTATTAVTSLAAAVSASGSLSGAPFSTLLPLQQAAFTAATGVRAALTAGDAAVDAIGDPSAAVLLGPGLADALAAQLAATSAQAALADLYGVVGRASANLSTVQA